MNPVVDKDIEALNLGPVAKAAAYALKGQFPAVVFTSGRRDKAEQAMAMASNVVKNRQWIVQTYAHTQASAACQEWVDDNPGATSQAQIGAGLLGVLNSLGDDVVGHLSKHLAGAAFDVQPVANGGAIMLAISHLRGCTKFLAKEGGLVRWHAEF